MNTNWSSNFGDLIIMIIFFNDMFMFLFVIVYDICVLMIFL